MQYVIDYSKGSEWFDLQRRVLGTLRAEFDGPFELQPQTLQTLCELNPDYSRPLFKSFGAPTIRNDASLPFGAGNVHNSFLMNSNDALIGALNLGDSRPLSFRAGNIYTPVLINPDGSTISVGLLFYNSRSCPIKYEPFGVQIAVSRADGHSSTRPSTTCSAIFSNGIETRLVVAFSTGKYVLATKPWPDTSEDFAKELRTSESLGIPEKDLDWAEPFYTLLWSAAKSKL